MYYYHERSGFIPPSLVGSLLLNYALCLVALFVSKNFVPSHGSMSSVFHIKIAPYK